MAKRQHWHYIRQLVSDGANLDINGGGYSLNIASLYLGEQQVCMFECVEWSSTQSWTVSMSSPDDTRRRA